MLDRTESKDIIIIDPNGRILYFSIEDCESFGLNPDEMIGMKVTMLYENLTDETSTLMKAVRFNEATTDFKETLETSDGRKPQQIGDTYPISDGENVVAAIEFSTTLKADGPERTLRKSHARDNGGSGAVYSIDDILTEHAAIEQVKRKIAKIACTDSPVLICGRTGTGKEMVAQAIHNAGGRKKSPFISLNCGALPEPLLEGLLFGTTKGSFTDAEDKMGIFEACQGGTLFLDEINSMPITMQAKLLKAIEDKSIRRVGGFDEISLNVRIIAACNVSSAELLQKAQLRSDLYFRLSVVLLDLPDLRERSGDILFLANRFVTENNKIYHRSVKAISKEIGDMLEAYDWPGNVRELRNVIEGAFQKTDKDMIAEEHLPARIRRVAQTEIDMPDDVSLKDFLANKERTLLADSLARNGNDTALVAKELEISKQSLNRRLLKHNLLRV